MIEVMGEITIFLLELALSLLFLVIIVIILMGAFEIIRSIFDPEC